MSDSPLSLHSGAETGLERESPRQAMSSLQQETDQLRTQLASYQEQVYQHSLTIVALEEKLVTYLTQVTDAPAKQAETEKKDKHTTTELFLSEQLPHVPSDLETSEEKQAAIYAKPQVSTDKRDESQFRYLRQRLFTLSERLEETESNLSLSRALNEKLQQTLQLKTSAVAHQHAELVELRGYLPQVRSALNHVEEEVVSIAANLTTESDYHSMVSPLLATAVRCTQDGHLTTIEKQAQALASLRVQVNQLEEANRLVPTHREALSEVARVREELRRARLALEGSDMSYLLQKKEEEDLKLTQQLDERSAELELEREAHLVTKESFHSFESIALDLIIMLSSKFYNLYRMDFKLASSMSQREMEGEIESRRKQIEAFSSKLSEYEDEILSRQPALDQENVREIERLSEVIQECNAKNCELKEEIFSLKIQKELLEKEKLYAPKRERIHSCLFTKEMVDILIQDEKNRFKVLIRKKNKEIAILRKTIAKYYSEKEQQSL